MTFGSAKNREHLPKRHAARVGGLGPGLFGRGMVPQVYVRRHFPHRLTTRHASMRFGGRCFHYPHSTYRPYSTPLSSQPKQACFSSETRPPDRGSVPAPAIAASQTGQRNRPATGVKEARNKAAATGRLAGRMPRVHPFADRSTRFDDRSHSIDQARLCSRPRGGRLLKDFSECSQVASN